MQSLPAQEGMFLHGVLHRIEGDYPNARAWYSDVSDTEVMESVGEERRGDSGREGIWVYLRCGEVGSEDQEGREERGGGGGAEKAGGGEQERITAGALTVTKVSLP